MKKLAWLILMPTLLAISAQSTAFAQGSLAPPGAPAPTMKSLTQIEPRTPISSLPFLITNGGSYYVTTNLTGVAGSDGISILANDVTIDLGGFTLYGPSNGTLEYGISSSTISNVIVMHGAIKAWPRSGISGTSIAGCQVLDIVVSRNGFSGIRLGDNSLVERCTADHNGLNNSGQQGIGVGTGCIVRDCIVSGHNGPSSEGIAGGGNCLVQHCTVTGNNSAGGAGIAPNGYSLIVDCVVADNRGDTNYVGISANAYSRVKNCVVSFNSGDGIRAAGNCSIIDNDCSENNGVGFNATGAGSRIDGNHAANNGAEGIKLSTANSCVVVRNTATDNGGSNYPAAASNIGPIQSPSTATSPWANFSF